MCYLVCHCVTPPPSLSPPFFFFNDPAPTEIYTLSLHDALPILRSGPFLILQASPIRRAANQSGPRTQDRKSTRLNSSHPSISYAVFCLKKKKKNYNQQATNSKSDTTTNITAQHTRYIYIMYILH